MDILTKVHLHEIVEYGIPAQKSFQTHLTYSKCCHIRTQLYKTAQDSFCQTAGIKRRCMYKKERLLNFKTLIHLRPQTHMGERDTHTRAHTLTHTHTCTHTHTHTHVHTHTRAQTNKQTHTRTHARTHTHTHTHDTFLIGHL
jgi:hypothetical protein